MRVALSWLREFVRLPADHTGRDVAERLTRAGFEVESVDVLGAGVAGPVVAGRVVAIDEFTASNGKTIRYCRVDVGEHNDADGSRGIVCGARNFEVGDGVVVALPGSVLPGGFSIGARRTYGHLSDGMICSARELELGDDHTGIIVLGDAPTPGTDVLATLGVRDEVLDVSVTPDRGYAMSMRGMVREVATAYELDFTDPAGRDVPAATGGQPVVLASPRCDRFVARTVTGLDPTATSPLWLRTRLSRAGMRPISLAVDVTNYVMLEIGQPLHAYDAATLRGAIEVRDAVDGETLKTLDGTVRVLVATDLVITDDSGPIGLAGVMGGADTEIGPGTTDIVLEAAHFDPLAVGVTSRRLRLGSEAARRFERGVDARVQAAAADRAVELLVQLGAATAAPGGTDVDRVAAAADVVMAASHPDRLAGVPYGREVVTARLEQVGCTVRVLDPSDESDRPPRRSDAAPRTSQRPVRLAVTPPSWRPDLQAPNDLAEEVMRLEGYETLPSVLPKATPGHGLTFGQRASRRIGRALAAAGFVEVLSYPFFDSAALDALGIDPGDPRRRLVRLVNPLSEEEPWLRSSLLPGLLATVRRNLGRGNTDLAVFETGSVFRAVARPALVPRPPVDRALLPAELAQLEQLLPEQPRHVAVVLTGEPWPPGPWGPGRPAAWADAVEAVRTVALAAGAEVDVRPAAMAPWHPGRCAEVIVGGAQIGWAGELHPRVVSALELPARACAAEVDLDAIVATATTVVRARPLSTYPAALRDLALVVPADVSAADVTNAVRAGAGELLEELRLFDAYTGEQVPPGHRSLALRLRLRAPDRTLTARDVANVVDAAVAEAARQTGATLRA